MMPRLPGTWTDLDQHTAVMILGEREFRRYGGVWCARTPEGTWCSARWLGALTVDWLLEHCHKIGAHEQPAFDRPLPAFTPTRRMRSLLETQQVPTPPPPNATIVMATTTTRMPA